MLPSIFGENLLDDLWRTDFDRDWFNMDRELYGKHAKNLMKTDVRESEKGYEMAIELPGVKKEDIRSLHKNFCKGNTHLPAAGKLCSIAVKIITRKTKSQ